MSEARGGRRISRKELLGLGLSTAAVLSSNAVSPFVAKARTVNFGAPGSTKLSLHCRGDGTDEAAKIEEVFKNYTFVEVDEPAGEKGYGIGRKEGVAIPSGLELDGTGYGKFIRAGNWKLRQVCFRNSDYVNGNTEIKLNNIHIEGRRNSDPTVPDIDKKCNTLCISFKVQDPKGEKLMNIELTGVEIRNWPGMGIRVFNGKHINYTDVKNINSSRGGIRFTAACYDINLLRCVATDVGESAFGLWASNFTFFDRPTETIAGDLHDIFLTDCRSSTRPNAMFGAALMIWGARRVTARKCVFGPAKNDVVHIHSDTWTSKEFAPKDILLENCEMLGGKQNSLQIISDTAARVQVRNSFMSKPAQNCVRIEPATRGRHNLDVAIVDNLLFKPGQRYIDVHDDVSGVRLGGNKLVGSDSTRPTITDVRPKGGSIVMVARPTIKATITDNKGGTGISKSRIKLAFDDKIIDQRNFTYTKNTLSYSCPTLKNGQHTVKIVARDRAGNTVSKSWSFKVRV